ncbi:MAG: hypothetical protein ACJA13_003884 [Paraglaciecola sp.]
MCGFAVERDKVLDMLCTSDWLIKYRQSYITCVQQGCLTAVQFREYLAEMCPYPSIVKRVGKLKYA